jgi:hypothetical protein
MKTKLLLGRKDKFDFPQLKLSNIDVKIDTGAYTSSIHCQQINEVVKNGQRFITFRLLDPSHLKYNNKLFKVSDFEVKRIKNSFGVSEERYIIKTTAVIYGELTPIELSLSERGEMKYPILIGRKVLTGKFIVDPALINLSSKHKKTVKNPLTYLP